MFYFVQELGDSASQRSKELEDSKRKSHAASALYRRNLILPKLSRSKTLSTRSSEKPSELKRQDVDWMVKRSMQGTFDDSFSKADSRELVTNNNIISPSIPHDGLGTRCDPFMYTPSGCAHDMSMVVDFQTRIVVPVLAPISYIFNVTDTFVSTFLWAPPNDAIVYAAVGSIQSMFDGLQQFSDHKTSDVALKYINRATISVRQTINELIHHYEEEPNQRLAQVIDSTIIIMIFIILWCQITGNLNVLRTHIRGLEALIKARGGLDGFVCYEGRARAALLQLDAEWVIHGAPTIFPSHRQGYKPIYPSIPFPKSLLSQVEILPPGFQAMAHMCLLPLDLIEVLTRATCAQTHYYAHGTVADESYLLRTHRRRFDDYLDACTCFQAVDEMVQVVLTTGESEMIASPNLQRLIVETLTLYCVNTFSRERFATSFYTGYKKNLTDSLPRKYITTQSYYNNFDKSAERCKEDFLLETNEGKWIEDVLLWISLVVIDSWRGATDSLLDSGIELLKMCKDRYRSVLTDWTMVEERLTYFFYNEGFIRRCTSYWEITP